jgi:hypothetical protein
MNRRIEQLKNEIQPIRNQLLSHPIFSQVNDLAALKKFTETHVFAVWDFMSLLKSLQIGLTSVSLPWVPVSNPNIRYLINEIVLGEESDVNEHGNRVSHFELYLSAMKQMGADTNVITSFIASLEKQKPIHESIAKSQLPEHIKEFLTYTFHVVENEPLYVKAAVFTFGREDLIPDMFTKILEEIYTHHSEKVSTFKYYIKRHIEVDGEHHSLLALEMVSELCSADNEKWNAAIDASKMALEKRIQLWDGMLANNIKLLKTS